MPRHGLPRTCRAARPRGAQPQPPDQTCSPTATPAGSPPSTGATATAPIYAAHEAGLPIHVFVDETRPRNQGAALTAWELGQHGVPHTLVVDNVGGHLMQHGKVDCVIVGTDRTTASGDVCNKIGTYLKALAAHANGVPFYVAAPSPSIDFAIDDGVRDIPIEERAASEVTHMSGLTAAGEIAEVQVSPTGSPVLNYAFDVTPAALVTGLITERGRDPGDARGARARLSRTGDAPSCRVVRRRADPRPPRPAIPPLAPATRRAARSGRASGGLRGGRPAGRPKHSGDRAQALRRRRRLGRAGTAAADLRGASRT